MKIFLISILSLVGFSAVADVGDKYTTPVKVGRVSMDYPLMELTGVTFSVDHDGDPMTANVLVKAAIDTSTDANAQDISGQMEMYIETARVEKALIGIVYSASNIDKTDHCLGKDMVYTDPENSFPSGKTCYVVQVKDVIIK